VLQLFALVSPLFFQVVMDKVLVHRGLTTLDVLVIGLVVVVVFESLLTACAAYVFSHTTSRIDVELGARLFRHLRALPLAYFQARRVGDSVARVRELENIRSFLTGNALTVVLDVLFSLVFMAVMLLYSVPLTLIVLVSLPLYLAEPGGGAGAAPAAGREVRPRRREPGPAGGNRHRHPDRQGQRAGAAVARRWDKQLAAYVRPASRPRPGHLGARGRQPDRQAGQRRHLWFGAHLVMDNELSVGQFVAFNMFAQRGPAHHAHGAAVDGLPADRHVGGAAGRHPQHPHRVPPAAPRSCRPCKGRITLDRCAFATGPRPRRCSRA
jgi:subfamily B ATP-binding cassette protein HlyB/CyaB